MYRLYFQKETQKIKKYFALQHPYLLVPNTWSRPNWKVDPFFKHFYKVSIQTVQLPEGIPINGRMAGFTDENDKKMT